MPFKLRCDKSAEVTGARKKAVASAEYAKAYTELEGAAAKAEGRKRESWWRQGRAGHDGKKTYRSLWHRLRWVDVRTLCFLSGNFRTLYHSYHRFVAARPLGGGKAGAAASADDEDDIEVEAASGAADLRARTLCPITKKTIVDPVHGCVVCMQRETRTLRANSMRIMKAVSKVRPCE